VDQTVGEQDPCPVSEAKLRSPTVAVMMPVSRLALSDTRVAEPVAVPE
jgi:hypothetical protein